MGFRLDRWYLTEEECTHVAVTVRGAEKARACGEAAREALALPQNNARSKDKYNCGGDNIKEEHGNGSSVICFCAYETF